MRHRAPRPPGSQVPPFPAATLGPAAPFCPQRFGFASTPTLPPAPRAPLAAADPADSRVPRVDSIMLLEEGFQVTSVDASDKMLKYALKERWERRKEEPFDRWGAGSDGAGKGVQTPTSYPGA